MGRVSKILIYCDGGDAMSSVNYAMRQLEHGSEQPLRKRHTSGVTNQTRAPSALAKTHVRTGLEAKSSEAQGNRAHTANNKDPVSCGQKLLN